MKTLVPAFTWQHWLWLFSLLSFFFLRSLLFTHFSLVLKLLFWKFYPNFMKTQRKSSENKFLPNYTFISTKKSILMSTNFSTNKKIPPKYFCPGNLRVSNNLNNNNKFDKYNLVWTKRSFQSRIESTINWFFWEGVGFFHFGRLPFGSSSIRVVFDLCLFEEVKIQFPVYWKCCCGYIANVAVAILRSTWIIMPSMVFL